MTRPSVPQGENTPAAGESVLDQSRMYLIRKGGAYYRPNAEGYTLNIDEAGRFTREDAIAHSYPNGPDGPRDGIRYMLAPALAASSPVRTDADGVREAWPAPKVTNSDIANPTGVPYLDCLMHRLLDAQQDVNEAANAHMDQALCNASAIMDEVERAIRQFAAISKPEGETGPADGVPDYPDMEEHGLDEPLEEALREMLLGGQGDDNGAQIMPDFEEGQSVLSMVHACLALLETRRDVIEGYANTEAQLRHRLSAMQPEGETGPAVAEPVAYRWRYYDGGPERPWYVRQSPVSPEEPSPGNAGIEVQPLFAALTASPSPSERDQHQGGTPKQTITDGMLAILIDDNERRKRPRTAAALRELAAWRDRAALSTPEAVPAADKREGGR